MPLSLELPPILHQPFFRNSCPPWPINGSILGWPSALPYRSSFSLTSSSCRSPRANTPRLPASPVSTLSRTLTRGSSKPHPLVKLSREPSFISATNLKRASSYSQTLHSLHSASNVSDPQRLCEQGSRGRSHRVRATCPHRSRPEMRELATHRRQALSRRLDAQVR